MSLPEEKTEMETDDTNRTEKIRSPQTLKV